MVARAFFDEIRSLNYTGISGAYAAVGGTFEHTVRMICFTNNTNGHVMFTDDVTLDKIFVAANSFKLWDIQANMNTQKDDSFLLPVGTQISVKQITAPSSGDVYVEVIY